jgi:hypothetical protein
VHGPRLTLGLGLVLGLALVGCKREPGPEAGSTAAKPGPAATRAQRLLEVPSDRIWAASAHLRVVDARLGQVVQGLDLSRSITGIAFTRDGARAFVAASDGVRELDPDAVKPIRQWTTHPARAIAIDEAGATLSVLEHQIVKLEGGARELQPFELVVYDLATGAERSREVVGHRILTMAPSAGEGRAHLVIEQRGAVRLVRPGQKLTEGETLEISAGFAADRTFGVRPYVARSADGRRVYLPVEGEPSRVAEIDVGSGAVRSFELGARLLLRGLAVTPDGTSLVVDASSLALRVDLATGKVVGRAELEGAHLDAAISSDGRRAYFAQPVHGTGGALTVLRLEDMRVQGRLLLDDISPWVIAVRPPTATAALGPGVAVSGPRAAR